MAKVEDAHLVRFKLRGKCAELSLAEPEYSLDELDHVRTETFDRLRKDMLFPNELLDLVERFEERTVVQPFVRKTPDGAGIAVVIKMPGEKTKKRRRDTVAEFAEMFAAGKRIYADEEKTTLTASEALAFFLRISLRDLKHAERTHNAAPVHTQRLVPRSVIAWVATDLLRSCEIWNYSPGPHLNALIRELLNVDGEKHGATLHVDAQKDASFIIAQDPKVHTRELARRLNVNASTISRWRRSPQFEEKVKQMERRIASLKSSGRWDEMIASAERT
jgi:hypothetical protein